MSLLFFVANIERAVALSASGRNYRAAPRESQIKKAGEAKGGGRREPRPRPHPRRPGLTDRPPRLQKITALLWNEYVL